MAKEYNELYYNKTKFSSSLDNFFIKYYNNDYLHNNNYFKAHDELFITLSMKEGKIKQKIDHSLLKDLNFKEVHSINRAFDAVYTVNFLEKKNWIGKSFNYNSYFVETEEFKRGNHTALRLYESIDLEERYYFLIQRSRKKNMNLQYYYSLFYLYNNQDKLRLLEEYKNFGVPNVYYTLKEKEDEDND